MEVWLNPLLDIARQGQNILSNNIPRPGVPNSLRNQCYEEVFEHQLRSDSKAGRKTSKTAGAATISGSDVETNFGGATDQGAESTNAGDADSVDLEGIGHCKISEWQAGWNITNAIQGMSLVSLPYAVLHGGYCGLFSLILVAYICCHTGKILVDCLYERDEKTGRIVRVRESYVEIAQVCFGQRFGGKIINAAQVIELLMTCILYVVLCGDLLIGTFPDGIIDMRAWMMLCTITLIPCALLKNLQSVSTLSLYCTIIHFVINAIIFAYCFLQISDWYWDRVSFSLDPSTFPVCLGIVVFSYTSQIFLPSLEGNMKEPAKFDDMLDWSHIAAGICKFVFAYVGFLTFGDATQEVITNNLPTRGFKALVNLTLVVKALLSYPLPYYAAAHLLEISFFKRKPTEAHPEGEGPQPFNSMWTRDGEYRVWAVALRVTLVMVTMFAAISIPHFALLLGFIGSFTGTMLSFVWPCYFHMYLRWNELDQKTIAWEIFIICLGVFFGVTGMYSSFTGLLEVGMVDFDATE
uniref:Vesicular inhibitory amino acid transporter n=1 Tax=Aceria tosichella TaxID=561515 RepID=A0A6G1S665_9ACAR